MVLLIELNDFRRILFCNTNHTTMAEFVQQSIEEMLPELEQMERVGLFTDQEIRQILKKRKSYEYKLRRKTKCKEDFLQYIQYEINLLALVKKRRKRTGYTFKRVEIDIAIVQRIHMLFRLASTRFQEDVKLWMSHIEFCKKRNEKVTISRLFNKMLQVHTRKAEFWILAAKWEFEDNSNPDNARGLLQRGLRFNEGSEKLWTEYYRMELLLTDKMRKRRKVLGANLPEADEDASDAVIKGEIAAVVYKMAVEALPGRVEIILSLLDVCRLFNFTSDQEHRMLKDLEEMFPNSPKTWEALAKTHLVIRDTEEQSAIDVLQLDSEEKFHMVFEEAVEKIPTSEMWATYLQASLELAQTEAPRPLKEKRLQRTISVFEEARKKNHLTPDLFLKWLQLVGYGGFGDEMLQLARDATARFPSSVMLWHKHIQLLINNDCSEEEIKQVFATARKSVKEKESWPLWELILECNVRNSTGDTIKFFETGLSCCREVSVSVKEMYLQWTYLTAGISKARNLYKRLCQLKPLSLLFYKNYIDMEKSQDKPKIKVLRRAYEEALRDFGTEDADIWIEYIKMETSHPDGSLGNAGKIHFQALKFLEGQLNQDFITRYTLLQTGQLIS
ncbi:hypothetical protein ScPMuIL_004991 [Solemya velum]